ncbi:MAG: DUF5689 domain-containing protein [Paludibacter sp.]
MKLNSLIAVIIVTGTLLFSGCNDNFKPAELTDQFVDTIISSSTVTRYKSDTLYTTSSISKLISDYSTDIGDLSTRIPSLFSVDTIPSNKDITVSGIVISNDNEGNIYKNMEIYDVKTKRALKISVDAGNLSALYPVGTLITLNCSGLAIGKYAQMLQLGIAFYNTTSGKTGFEIGRIPYTMFLTRVKAYKTKVIPSTLVDTMTIAQIRTSGPELHNRLVCIKNAYFTQAGADYGAPKPITIKGDSIFAPSTNGIGYPQSREIKDATGSVFIATSEYSKFAKIPLPSATMTGNITAIVGWYNDKDAVTSSSKIYHQLTLRSLGDLGKGFENFHQLYY